MRDKKTPPRQDSETFLEYISFRATRWVGSPASLVFHTVVFIGSFLLFFFGVELNTILLVLTTIVSLEAIYISILIQMSVNQQTKHIREVAEDIDEIQEDVEEIQEDIDEIQEDVDEIQEDVEEIQEEDEEEEDADSDIDTQILSRIEQSLRDLGKEIAEMKRKDGR